MTTIRHDCRCCRGVNLSEVFTLGEQPRANAFLTAEQLGQPEEASPLILMECQDCGHVQLRHVANARELYRDYSFQTGSSRRMAAHFAGLMNNAVGYVPAGGLVVEIGSNDGTALESIQRADVRRLGVDPAANLATLARERGVDTSAMFFTEAAAHAIRDVSGRAELIVACNVLAHIDDLDDFCRGIDALLSRDGALIIEVPNVDRLIDETEFGQVYHEHLSYFGIGSLVTLFARHGLRVEQVEPFEVHGGSMRPTVRRGGGNRSLLYPTQPRDWPAFNRRCEVMRATLLDWLYEQRDFGRTVWGYCAAAKATVLLNYCGIGPEMMPVIVDNTPTKQERYMPGTHQPILSPEEVISQMPDAVIVLAENHFAEITRREAAFTAAGGLIVNPRKLPIQKENRCVNY